MFAFNGLLLWQNLWTAVRSRKGFCAQLVQAVEAWACLEGGVNFWKGSGVKKKGTFLSSGLDTRPRGVSAVPHETLPPGHLAFSALLADLCHVGDIIKLQMLYFFLFLIAVLHTIDAP